MFQSSTVSRLPVYRETLDQPVGLVHLKDLALRYGFGASAEGFDLRGLLRPLLYAPPSMPIGVLLQKMQAARIHMALVIDEYGGVDGLVTIEDLIEQIVGEIDDEHDEAEGQLWSREAPGVYLAQARIDLADFEAATGVTAGRSRGRGRGRYARRAGHPAVRPGPGARRGGGAPRRPRVRGGRRRRARGSSGCGCGSRGRAAARAPRRRNSRRRRGGGRRGGSARSPGCAGRACGRRRARRWRWRSRRSPGRSALFLALPLLLWLLEGTARAARGLRARLGGGRRVLRRRAVLDRRAVPGRARGLRLDGAVRAGRHGRRDGALLGGRLRAGAGVWPAGARRGVVALAALWTLAEYRARARCSPAFLGRWSAMPGSETPVIQAVALFGPHALGFLTLIAGAAAGARDWRARWRRRRRWWRRAGASAPGGWPAGAGARRAAAGAAGAAERRAGS